MNTKTKAWVNIGVLVLTLIVNFLGGTGMINNASQGEVSDANQTLITPAGFTFSIWSLIYGILFISVIVMLVKEKESYYHLAIESISPLFWLSSVFNMIWIVLFSYYQIGLSTIFIFAYLISLALIVQRLRGLEEKKRWLLPLAFGLNTGWLFIASVVNVAAFLVQINWDGFGIVASTWALIMLSVSVVLAGIVLLRLKNAAFPLPIAWAYFGIWQALRASANEPVLEIITIAGAVILVALAGLNFIRNQKAIYPIHN